ncbi:MAG: phage tail protein [Selenomonadaceae bacterium]|nr:phage tail protein [Selenomonadaceae bacterium]
MIPILYDAVTEGSVPASFGVGNLTDCISATVTEERNGAYELALTYPANGIHAEEIQPNRIIKAKPNYTDNPQLFRIYKVGKTMAGQFTVYAQHISYDLSGKIITTGTAASCVAACALLEGAAGSFTITTDKTVSAPFKIAAPSSVRSWFGGKEGSLLDVYGSAEWQYDNYACSLKQARGADRGVEIRYGKNLAQLSQELNMENLCTGVYPYYIDSNTGTVTTGAKVATGLVLDVDKDRAVDFSNDVNPESATPILTQLANLAAAYVANNNFTDVVNSITLDFVQVGELKNRVDLCDTVHIYFEALGITASAKCVTTVWDVLQERYTQTTFGNPRVNIADTLAEAARTLQETPTASNMQKAIQRATDLISGNLGGFVVWHDSDGDGYPDEILVMDTADINTATRVWRWNVSGLGFSNSGYAGPYSTLALTMDGEIVADAITTGVLNADLIKAGVIEDVAHNSQIDMTNGEATLYQLKAKNRFSLINSANTVKASLTHQVNGGSTFRLFTNSGDLRSALFNDPAGGDEGTLYLYNHYNQLVIRLEPASNGDAYLYLYDQTGAIKTYIGAPSTGGFMLLYDSGGNASIDIDGQLGKITCRKMSVTQQTAYNISMSGAWASVDEFTIYRMGNLCYVRLVLLGDGTSVASGANGATGTLTDGDLPIVDAKLVEYYGSNAIIANIDTSGNITVRNVGAALAVAVGGKIELSGSFMVA